MRKKPYPSNLIHAIYAHKDNKTIDMYIKTINLDGLYNVLPTLTEQEQSAIENLYKEGQTLMVCGEHLGVSTARVREVREKALRKLRIKWRRQYYETIPEAEPKPKELAYWQLQEQVEWLMQENRTLKNALIGVNIPKTNLKPEHLEDHIEHLELSNGTRNALARGGINTISDVLSTTDEQFENLRCFGRKKRAELNAKLAAYSHS